MKHITFDSLQLFVVASELQFLRGGRIQRIVQPEAREVVLSVYAPGRGQTHWLFNADSHWFRTHALTSRPAGAADKTTMPPAFCMTLRKYLEGGTILSMEQRGFDRVLDVKVRGYEGEVYVFSAELMGRNSNLLLIGPDQKLLHAARFSPPDSVRPVLPGQPYAPPPVDKRRDPRTIGREDFLRLQPGAATDFARWLNEHFQGMSRLLAREIAARCSDAKRDDNRETPDEARWQAFESVLRLARAGNWQPHLYFEGKVFAGAYPLLLESTSWRAEPRPNLNIALEEYFGAAVPQARIEDERRALTNVLQKELGAKTHALEQIAAGVRESGRETEYRKWGESILANLRLIPRRAEAAELPDYYADPPGTMRVPLDAEMTPQENAERYFTRARHVAENAERLRELRQRMAAEKDAVEETLLEIELADELPQLRELRERARTRGWLASNTGAGTAVKQPRNAFEGKKIRTFTSPDGYTVLVGENATANDYLVQRVAASDDWWLHVRTHASAHVVIRTNKEPQRVPPATLYFAARLAAERSTVRHSNAVEVDYTLRKYVRRPRHAAPGQVLRTHEKTLRVEM